MARLTAEEEKQLISDAEEARDDPAVTPKPSRIHRAEQVSRAARAADELVNLVRSQNGRHGNDPFTEADYEKAKREVARKLIRIRTARTR